MDSEERKTQEGERARYLENLRNMLPPGTTVYAILRSVSRSGMRRNISLIGPDYTDITWQAAKVCRFALAKNKPQHEIIVSGAGMDMGFHLVYELSHVLYSNGFACIGGKCPSSDHANREGHTHHKDGGYALNQRWL